MTFRDNNRSSRGDDTVENDAITINECFIYREIETQVVEHQSFCDKGINFLKTY